MVYDKEPGAMHTLTQADLGRAALPEAEQQLHASLQPGGRLSPGSHSAIFGLPALTTKHALSLKLLQQRQQTDGCYPACSGWTMRNILAYKG